MTAMNANVFIIVAIPSSHAISNIVAVNGDFDEDLTYIAYSPAVRDIAPFNSIFRFGN